MQYKELNLAQFFLILRAHLRLILILFFGAVTIAGVITILLPKMYTSSTSLNFDFKGGNPLSDNTSESREGTYLVTQVNIITSQNVAQKVVNSLSDFERQKVIDALKAKNTAVNKAIGRLRYTLSNLFVADEDKEAGGADAAQPSAPTESIRVSNPYSWMAGALLSDLDVEPLFGSRLVEISYSSTDPKIAALIANKFASAYIDENLNMIVDPARRTSAWFDEQLKSLRDKLEAAQEKLTTYQQKQGIVATDERVDTETRRLSELSSQLVDAQQQTRGAETTQRRLEEIRAKGAPLISLPEIYSQPVIQSVRKDIRNLESKLAELSSKLGENHPQYQRVKAELEATKVKLDNEIKSVVEGINNTTKLAKEREASLKRSLEDQKQLVLNLKYQRDEITVLMREVDSAQSTYNTALEQLNKSRLESVVDQTNVYVVDPASIPGGHSSPKAMKNLVLGALIGLMLGVGLSVLLELMNRRIRSREDIMNDLGLVVLGTLHRA